jgi:membrane protease subunit HflK
MMQSVLGSTSKVLVNDKSGRNLLYLPLDKLVSQAAAGAAADAGGNPPTTTSVRNAPPAPDTSSSPIDPRSREALRNREGR